MRPPSLSIFAFLALAGLVKAKQHGLIVGNFVQGSLYSVTYDDETFELELVGNTTVPAPSSWLSWSVSVLESEHGLYSGLMTYL
jgi:hypothetical protein